MHASSQPSNLNQKRILLGVSGGIAAYKIPDLVRKLRQAGAEVEVVLTEAASQFVAPLALQAVNGKAPRLQLLPQRQQDAQLPGDAMEHISLVRWADLVVIAPATANMLARLASGQADDLLAALCLAIDRPDLPKVIVPAMNRAMWDHAQTQANLAHLQRSGWHFIGPDTGSQACGEEGKGRMTEPESIVEHLSGCFSTGALQARRVVVNAGGTHEYIDPVRFIGNRSSGRMGFALAQAAAEAGAVVDLVAGPVSLPTPDRV
ncbi:MAG: bifunctional phosphopantothenoylcysteine decarboxylase/phosphopantothenate--cysteine ligase CoaBC, partial [Gammaproteobacteria bacterium]